MQCFKFLIMDTRQDAHGETHSKSDLEAILATMPSVSVLHHHHDVSLPVVGKLSNPRLEPVPEEPGHWALVADAEIREGVALAELGTGFSISFTQFLARNAECPTLAIYLPFPTYNESAIIDALLDEFPNAAVGKFVKKTADLALVALIVGAVYFVLRPAWQHTYDELVRPHWQRILDAVKALGERGVGSDVQIFVQVPGRADVKVRLIPERGNEPASLAHGVVSQLLEDVRAQLLAQEAGDGRWPQTVVAVYEPTKAEYRVCQMTFEGGESLYFA